MLRKLEGAQHPRWFIEQRHSKLSRLLQHGAQGECQVQNRARRFPSPKSLARVTAHFAQAGRDRDIAGDADSIAAEKLEKRRKCNVRHVHPMCDATETLAQAPALLLDGDRVNDDRSALSIDAPAPARVAHAVSFHRQSKSVPLCMTLRIGEGGEVK